MTENDPAGKFNEDGNIKIPSTFEQIAIILFCAFFVAICAVPVFGVIYGLVRFIKWAWQ